MSKAKAKAAAVEEVEEVDRMGPADITALEQQGISAGDVKKLQVAGMYTVEAVAYSTKKALLAIKVDSDVRFLRNDFFNNFFLRFF
jgi:DNA repair protein RAD51